MVQQAPTGENRPVLDVIYTKLFSEEYDSKINPTLQFSKAQIETLLETICQWFLKYGYHDEAYRSIYYCASPLAESWIKSRKNDKKWFEQFAHLTSTYYSDPLDLELEEAFESAMEFIEDYKHEACLEYKDKKSHIFWQIKYYDGSYFVSYGEAGGKSKDVQKHFKSREACYKAGHELVAAKLKKGYKKTDGY